MLAHTAALISAIKILLFALRFQIKFGGQETV